MTKLNISKFHCKECGDDMIRRLEQATGVSGFRYDASNTELLIPENTDLWRVEYILNADKIFIHDQDEISSARIRDQKETLSANEHIKQETSCFSTEEAQVFPAPVKELENRSDLPASETNDEHHHHRLSPDHLHEEKHEHSQNHSHSHNHHALESVASEKNILGVFLLNLIFSIIEFVAGLLLNSTAIFSDSIHDFGDALSVGLAWGFERISLRHKNHSFTFGHRRFSLLGALLTGSVLIAGSVFALVRALPRLLNPQPVDYTGMMWLAFVAIAVNGLAAYLLNGRNSRSESILNTHMLEDLLGWIGILVISIILRFRPWYILDPIVSILIALYILKEAWSQTVSTLRILLESVPEGVQIAELEEKILSVPGIHGFSHLHFWSMDGKENNFAVTLFTEESSIEEMARIRKEVQALVSPQGVSCATIEIDYDPDRLILGRH